MSRGVRRNALVKASERHLRNGGADAASMREFATPRTDQARCRADRSCSGHLDSEPVGKVIDHHFFCRSDSIVFHLREQAAHCFRYVLVHWRVGSCTDRRAQKHFRPRQSSSLKGSEKLPTHFDVRTCVHESIVNPSTQFLQEGTGWLGVAHTKNEFLKNDQPARPYLAGQMVKNSRWLSQVHQNQSSDDGINRRSRPEAG
jgi:hypothetical protein